MRERVAIIFMTLSVVATLGLGGAIAYEFSNSSGPSAPVSAVQGGGATTEGRGAVSGSSTGGRVQTSAGSSGSKGTSGHTVTTGGGSKGTATTSGTLSNTASAKQGVSHGVITVGGIYDETGAVDATVERDTVRAYFNMVNAQGGVNGYKLRLIDCDSKYDPSQAHECSQRLLDQGILAIVGWLSVSGEQPEAEFLTKNGVPIIGGLGVPSEFASPISFPTTASLVRYGTALGTHAADLHIKKPGVIVLNSNFIKPVEDALLRALRKHGADPVDVEEVDATKADYTDVVLKLRQDGADSIVAGLDPFSYARLFQAMQRQNWHPKFLGLGLDKQSANRQYREAVYGAESVTPLLEPADHMNTPAIKQYYGTVRKYYPNQVSALDIYSEGDWVAAQVFVEAIRKIGDKPVTRKNLVDALNSIKNFDTGLSPPISYSPGSSHDPDHCFEWIHNVKSHWKTYSSWKCF